MAFGLGDAVHWAGNSTGTSPGGKLAETLLSVQLQHQQVGFKRVNLKEGERGQVQGLFFIVFCSLAIWLG